MGAGSRVSKFAIADMISYSIDPGNVVNSQCFQHTIKGLVPDRIF